MTTILSSLFLKGGIINFSDATGNVIKVTFRGVFSSAEVLYRAWPLAILFILIPILSGIIIFLFRKRSLQIIMSKVLLTLIIIFIVVLAIYSYIVADKFNADIIPGFKMAIPLVQLIFTFLAYRGIKKDDDLVKSYDRLR